jgi:hypothetical protein
MNKNLSQLFKQAYNHPESRLSGDIWRAIQAKEARSLKIQSLFYGFIGILSLGGFVFIAITLKKQFASSGFFEYVSLIFSDSGLIALYWKEYLLSLADSLPVASLGALLFLLVSALISIKKAVQQYKNKLLVAKL